MMEFDEGFSVEVNKPGCYNTVCVELDIISLAINTLIQVRELGADLNARALMGCIYTVSQKNCASVIFRITP